MKTYLITGCAGFIGSNLVDFLLNKKCKIIGLDNLSTGNKFFLKKALKNKNFKFVKIDLFKNNIEKYFKNVDRVYHLAANADVRFGLNHRKKDINQNIIVTYKVLESIKKNKVKKIIFSSTGSVYGETKQIPTAEIASFPIQTSLYAASKVSAEAIISAYCEAYNIKSYIFRFVSILGERYTHGHVFDFVKKLKKNKNFIKVLGDGNQKKSYLHVSDCLKAIDKSIKNCNQKINIINLGTQEYLKVKDSVSIISKCLKLKPKVIYLGGKRGWIGDNPFIYLDTKKIRSTGWKPKFNITESIKITTNYLMKNSWLLNRKN
ncbi:MAG: nucleoside-diphosphate sugar epimerase [Candidatus Pelagibacter sp.]|nr:nucleoside-diphosphate sugar epimerase [Candidatus Pelagibacter sp.]|tara:strand:- start:14492 stop:15448 length:957 start_codon:yes stop_codon:yes gene_type:complete